MSPPWMPLYVGDYLADTAHLRAAESGAYLHLIMHYWRNGGLPSEDDALARIAKMTNAEWKRARPVLIQLFQDGWRHKRIEFELTEAARISEAGRKGGVASGEARRKKSKAKPNDRSTTVQRLMNDQRTNGEALHSPSHTPEAKASGEPSKTRKLRKKPEMPLSDDWHPSEGDLAYGRKIGLSDSEMSRELERFRNGARSKDRRLSDWGAGFRNWLLKATEFMGREPPRSPDESAPVGFYAAATSQELDAWDRYRERTMGKSYPRDAKGGWNFPTQWPPGHEQNAAA